MELVPHLVIVALAVNVESFSSSSEESSGILPVPFKHQLRPSVEDIPSLPTYKKPKGALKVIIQVSDSNEAFTQSANPPVFPKHILTMSGHSHFSNIQNRKGRQDKKRSKNFEKCIREITVAARMGLPDPNANPRLRQAIQAAKKKNLPRGKIEAAIKNAIGNAAKESYEEVQYEAYGPSGTALMIKVQTDNRNRISGYLRRVFNQRGGNLGESGTVKHLFDHVGLIVYRTNETQFDDIFEFATDLDVIDIEEDADVGIAEITCDMKRFGVVRDALYKRFGDPELARLAWKPKSLVEITDKHLGDKLARLIEALEDIDDVQYVETNFSLPDRGETKE